MKKLSLHEVSSLRMIFDVKIKFIYYLFMKIPKYPTGQHLQHCKSGGFYRILHHAKIEATLEDVYVYEASSNHTVWIRPVSEMEDGRFIPLTNTPQA